MSQLQTLEALADRAELTDLVSRLGRWLDGGARGDSTDVLADEIAVQTAGGRSEGRSAVTAQAQRAHAVPTQHVITNVLAEVDGEAASVTANLVVTFTADGAVTRRLGELYRFEAARTAAGWRLTSVAIDPIWER